MNYLEIWHRALSEKRGRVEAAKLTERVKARYDDLYAQRPHIAKRALRFHLVNNILHGLALYQTLLEETLDQTTILEEWNRLFIANIIQNRRMKLIPLLGRLPNPSRYSGGYCAGRYIGSSRPKVGR